MSNNKRADLVVYGKIFTSENNQLAEAFAVKDGKFVYVGDKNGAETFIEAGKTQVLDYTGKGLVMPACGNGHAHYSIGVALPMVGTVVSGKTTPEEFLKEVVPAAVKKARETGGSSWMPSAVISPFTLPMTKATRAWPIRFAWSRPVS